MTQHTLTSPYDQGVEIRPSKLRRPRKFFALVALITLLVRP